MPNSSCWHFPYVSDWTQVFLHFYSSSLIQQHCTLKTPQRFVFNDNYSRYSTLNRRTLWGLTMLRTAFRMPLPCLFSVVDVTFFAGCWRPRKLNHNFLHYSNQNIGVSTFSLSRSKRVDNRSNLIISEARVVYREKRVLANIQYFKTVKTCLLPFISTSHLSITEKRIGSYLIICD